MQKKQSADAVTCGPSSQSIIITLFFFDYFFQSTAFCPFLSRFSWAACCRMYFIGIQTNKHNKIGHSIPQLGLISPSSLSSRTPLPNGRTCTPKRNINVINQFSLSPTLSRRTFAPSIFFVLYAGRLNPNPRVALFLPHSFPRRPLL